MEVKIAHPWDLPPQEARQLQEKLRKRILLSDRPGLQKPGLIAGIDNTYLKEGAQTTAIAAVVVLKYPSLEIIETCSASLPIQYPYLPGLLSFREGPAILAALRKLENKPDLLFFDGHGYAHPRRLGIAAHLGLVLQVPSIGIAKSRLVGEYILPEQKFGAYTWLVDGSGQEQLGMVLRTRPPYKPVFISPGWGVSYETALHLTLTCCSGRFRLPEPTRLAHKHVTALRHQQLP